MSTIINYNNAPFIGLSGMLITSSRGTYTFPSYTLSGNFSMTSQSFRTNEQINEDLKKEITSLKDEISSLRDIIET